MDDITDKIRGIGFLARVETKVFEENDIDVARDRDGLAWLW